MLGRYGNLRNERAVMTILIVPRSHSAPPLVRRYEIVPHLLSITREIQVAMAKGTHHQFKPPPPFISPWTWPHPKQAAPSQAIMMKIPPQVPSQPTNSGLPYAGPDAAPPEGTTPKEHPPQKAPPKCVLRVPPKAVQKAPPKAPRRHEDLDRNSEDGVHFWV